MPITQCVTCGQRFDHPGAWFSHLDNCNPARRKEVVTAMRGLETMLLIAQQDQQQESPR